MKHHVENYRDKVLSNEYTWAIMWKDFVVCLASKKEDAEAVAWALDEAKPYFDTEPE
jgi:hypothetical protein